MDNLTISHQSGVVRTILIDHEQYNVSHLFCSCNSATIVLSPDQSDIPDAVSVTIDCEEHGKLMAFAIKCGLTFRCEPIKNKTVFAWVNERHEHDRRIAWGMKQRIK